MQFRRLLKSIYPVLLILTLGTFLLPLEMKGVERKKFVVVVDAGHGGNDHGAIENGVNEKDVNLAVALKLENLIKKKLKDTDVVLTRDDDTFISLQKRADIANKAQADLFVSIHCNSVDRSNKNRANVVGATTYVLGHHKDGENLAVAQRENKVAELDADDSAHFANFDPSSDESHIIFEMTQKKNFQNSIRFAADVQREMASLGRVSRGVQQAGFWVLWSTAAPAALVELDFICNPEQAKFLSSKEGQEKLAEAIFNAVKKYETYYRISMGTASAKTSNQKSTGGDTGKKVKNAPVAKNQVETSASSPETEQPLEDETLSMEMAELPVGNEDTERRHRTAPTASNTRKPKDGQHRRRSNSAREEGASKIEEVTIFLTEEVTGAPMLASTSTTETSDNQASTKTSKKKAGKKEESKKKELTASTPGRRSKDKAPSRKSIKQSVNVDYRVLLFVSDEELLANDEAFHGLKPVATFRENNKFKYTYGESADRSEMEGILLEIASLFPEARVIKCYY